MKLENMLSSTDTKPLENLVVNGGYTAIFRRIGLVGDSLSSGEFESICEDAGKGYHDYYEHSWGQYLARMCGSECICFSRGGMTAEEYCESYADSMRFWDSKNACQCYIIALGVNDILNRDSEIGSTEDIDMNDWRNNKKTFIGYYAQIIQRLKDIQPRARFFLMTIPKEEGRRSLEKIELHRKAVFEIAGCFDNTYVLDFSKYAPVYDSDFRKKFFMGGHMNPMGYLLTAHMVASYIDFIIRHNTEDFKDVGFIGTNLTFKE